MFFTFKLGVLPEFGLRAIPVTERLPSRAKAGCCFRSLQGTRYEVSLNKHEGRSGCTHQSNCPICAKLLIKRLRMVRTEHRKRRGTQLTDWGYWYTLER